MRLSGKNGICILAGLFAAGLIRPIALGADAPAAQGTDDTSFPASHEKQARDIEALRAELKKVQPEYNKVAADFGKLQGQAWLKMEKEMNQLPDVIAVRTARDEASKERERFREEKANEISDRVKSERAGREDPAKTEQWLKLNLKPEIENDPRVKDATRRMTEAHRALDDLLYTKVRAAMATSPEGKELCAKYREYEGMKANLAAAQKRFRDTLPADVRRVSEDAILTAALRHMLGGYSTAPARAGQRRCFLQVGNEDAPDALIEKLNRPGLILKKRSDCVFEIVVQDRATGEQGVIVTAGAITWRSLREVSIEVGSVSANLSGTHFALILSFEDNTWVVKGLDPEVPFAEA